MFVLTRIFLQIPFEYGGMGSVSGKHYEATKDFLKWNNFSVKDFTPVVLQMGRIFAEELQNKK